MYIKWNCGSEVFGLLPFWQSCCLLFSSYTVSSALRVLEMLPCVWTIHIDQAIFSASTTGDIYVFTKIYHWPRSGYRVPMVRHACWTSRPCYRDHGRESHRLHKRWILLSLLRSAMDGRYERQVDQGSGSMAGWASAYYWEATYWSPSSHGWQYKTLNT